MVEQQFYLYAAAGSWCSSNIELTNFQLDLHQIILVLIELKRPSLKDKTTNKL